MDAYEENTDGEDIANTAKGCLLGIIILGATAIASLLSLIILMI